MKEATCGKCSAMIGWDDTPNPICIGCEREEDRAAINEVREFISYAAWVAWNKKHAAAITRAQGTSHE